MATIRLVAFRFSEKTVSRLERRDNFKPFPYTYKAYILMPHLRELFIDEDANKLITDYIDFVRGYTDRRLDDIVKDVIFQDEQHLSSYLRDVIENAFYSADKKYSVCHFKDSDIPNSLFKLYISDVGCCALI